MSQIPISQSDSIEKMIEPGGQYSISNWLNYNNLSPIQRRYALALSTIYEPKSFAEASQHPDWCKAMNIG